MTESLILKSLCNTAENNRVLDRDLPLQLGVGRVVDLAHPDTQPKK